MQAFAYTLYLDLGVFIPLIVVNCIVLGRAEAFASKNGLIPSAADGLGIGLGFTLSLAALGAVRELLGTGGLKGVFASAYEIPIHLRRILRAVRLCRAGAGRIYRLGVDALPDEPYPKQVV